MPFAFSTLGCPDATLPQVLALSAGHDAAGLELRCAPGALVEVGMDDADRAAVRRACAAADVTVLTLAGYTRVCDPGDDEAVVAELRDQLRLAGGLGARYLRVFPGAAGAGPDGDSRAVRRLARVVPDAAAAGVSIALETHDSHPRGADLAPILRALDARSPGHRVAVVWDALHPWRAGEDPARTLSAIDPWLAYVQIKDADPDGTLRRVGRGALPLDALAELLADRPGLWWSLEWERLWHPELPDLDIALGDCDRWRQRVGLR